MNESNTITNKTCFHCGGDCNDSAIGHEEKFFCCQGCKTVYEILSENDLDDYYDFEANPGIKKNRENHREKFAYLDEINIQNKLLNFSSEKLGKISFRIPAIHCSSCVWLLENLYKLNRGVLNSNVNFNRKKVYIDFDPNVTTLKEVVELLSVLGYEPEINLENFEGEKIKSDQKGLFIKMGVAAFCFANIMLLSFPDYLGLGNTIDQSIQQFIIYLNVLLSLPVFFYCSADYFRSAFLSFSQKYINIDVPIALGILALFSRSLYEVIAGIGQGYFDSLAGLLFFLLIGKWFQSKTYESLSFDKDYKSFFPVAITRIKGLQKEIVPINSLEENDRISVRNRELIPSDSTLLSDSASIDYSFVTGESELVNKEKGDLVYAGGRLIGQTVELLVNKKVSQSYLTQLWNKESFTEDNNSKTQQLVNVISKYFTVGILAIAMITAAYWWWVDASKIVNTITAILIVACPCALSMATPFALGTAMRVLGKNGFYLRNTSIIETINKVKLIVFDKTGTISYPNRSKISYEGEVLNDNEKAMLWTVSSQSTHPLSVQIKNFLADQIPSNSNLPLEGFEEIIGKGISALVDGKKVLLGSYKFMQNHDGPEERGQDTNIASVYVSLDEHIKGKFLFRVTYRADTDTLIDSLSEDYKLGLLSGDNDAERPYLEQLFPTGTPLSFSKTPTEKLEYIQNLQKDNKKIMMIGDGLNDAGALKVSDVGVAVTEDVSTFSPESDAILDGKILYQLPIFLHFCKDAYRIVIAGFVISFLYNFVGLSFAVTGNLSPLVAAILMPLSSITVVGFATFSVNLLGKIKQLK